MNDRIDRALHALPLSPASAVADARAGADTLTCRTFLLDPPYEDYCPVALAALRPHPGAILAFEVSTADVSPRALGGWVARRRLCVPAVPLVLRLRRLETASAHLIRRAGALQVRAVICGDEPIAATLRRALTNPVDLGGDIEEWLSIRFPGIDPSVPPVAGHIVRAASAGRHVAGLFRRIGIPERTIRLRFARAGLPPPGACLRAMAALWAILALQQDVHRSQSAVAQDHGYADQSALSHQIQRIYGEGPGTLRDLLGWEWLLDRWLTQHAAKTHPTSHGLTPRARPHASGETHTARTRGRAATG